MSSRNLLVDRDSHGWFVLLSDKWGYRRKERLKCRSVHANAKLAERIQADVMGPGFRRFAGGEYAVPFLFQKYLDCLFAKGRSMATIKQYRFYGRRVIRLCRWNGLADITESSFLKWRVQQKVGALYLDRHLLVVAMFLDWLVIEGYAWGNPLRKTSLLGRVAS